MSSNDDLTPKPDSSAQDELSLGLEQLLQVALGHQKEGQLPEAEYLLKAILEIQPAHPQANHALGISLKLTSSPSASLSNFAAALKASPLEEQYWVSYLDTLIEAGETETAAEVLKLGQKHGLRNNSSPVIAGFVAAREPRSELPTTRQTRSTSQWHPPRTGARGPASKSLLVLKAHEQAPTDGEIRHFHQLFSQGQFSEMECLARDMVGRTPLHGYGWKVLGAALQAQNKLDDALLCMRKSVDLRSGDAEALNNLGSTLWKAGYPLDAEISLRRAITIKPGYVEAYSNLGITLLELGRFKEAEEQLRLAIKLNPDFAPAHSNLGLVCKDQGRLDEAETSLLRALQLNSQYHDALCNLGLVYQDQRQQRKAAEIFRHAMTLRPEDGNIHSNLLFCLLLESELSPQQLFAEHRAFGEKFEGPLRPDWPAHGNAKDPKRRLKIGIVSGDLFHHAVANFIGPLVKHWATNNTLALHAYYSHHVNDSVTEQLRNSFEHWNAVQSLSDADLAKKIQDDGIDILVDLSGHTARNRLLTFARKPAPIQVSWMGYPATTGLRSMDYYFAAEFLAPPGLMDDQFTEKLVTLKASAPLQASDLVADVNALPALGNGFLTFGSFNRPNKISPRVVALWSQVLRALPTARMFLAGIPDMENSAIASWFAEHGITKERLQFHARCDLATYLKLHQCVDIHLDTFPYSGGTTTLHALSMGVPTLTIPGKIAFSRVSGAEMNQVGLDNFVAGNPDEYLNLALYWSQNLDELATIRKGLPERLLSSHAGRPRVVADHIESAFRSMWRRWCGGLPAQSFAVSI
jgi:predicted O-linked N-acetylglucosamine transferase (SPINDLY family)